MNRRVALAILTAVIVAAVGIAAALLLPDDEPVGRPDVPDDTVLVPPLHPRVDALPVGVVALTPAEGEPVTVRVRIASTTEERAHGLMGVEELPPGTGMLFVYEEDSTSGFWMKDTLIPLDIAWATVDGEIVAVQTMVPCLEDPCPTYPPGHPYRFALEVPAGWLEESRIGVGDQLELIFP